LNPLADAVRRSQIEWIGVRQSRPHSVLSERNPDAIRPRTWLGLFAPRGTPRDIIGKLNAAAMDALADPALRPRLADLGHEIFLREQQTPEALGALQKADVEKWWPTIKAERIERV
jgi:tripartite-type tricarboxylate transporter receptor subunit TctC